MHQLRPLGGLNFFLSCQERIRLSRDSEVIMCDWQVKNEENDRMRKFYRIDLAQTAREHFSAVSVTDRSAL